MFNRQSIHIAMLLWGTIFCCIAALCLFMSKNFDREKRKWLLMMQVACAVLLFNDALAWNYGADISQTGWYLVESVILWYSCSVISCYCYTMDTSVSVYLKMKRRTGSKENGQDKSSWYHCGVAMVLVVISQFTNLYYYIDAQNLYHRNTTYILSLILPMCGMLLDLSLIISYRERISKMIRTALISYIILPFLAAIILMFYYGISLINIAISISLVAMFVMSMVEQNQKLAKKEQEALDLKIAILMSQIAPHFIYNTLSAIQALCEIDPMKAKETVEEFALYLRGNLNSLTEKNLIPFEQELEHVKAYLSIEQKRFGERVKVKYDIRENNFRLPPLTLQPLAENAVKHGLCKKDDGGTLVIQTWQEGDDIKITICDDGTGFDVDKLKTKSMEHIGIRNVRKRMKEMCNGTLVIESEPGKGTRVVLTMPRIL